MYNDYFFWAILERYVKALFLFLKRQIMDVMLYWC